MTIYLKWDKQILKFPVSQLFIGERTFTAKYKCVPKRKWAYITFDINEINAIEIQGKYYLLASKKESKDEVKQS